MNMLVRHTLFAMLTISAAAGPAMAWDSFPDQTADGLDRVKNSKADAVYWKEGADLADYDRVRIDDVEVSFKKNWLRDQNRDRRSVTDRVTSQDMDEIRTALADLFRQEFTEELEKGGYEVVEENGPDVLLLQPSIIDLDVVAPDIGMRQPGMSRTYTTSAGEMTLHLDFRDSATNALIGRAIDHREDRAPGGIQYTNSITNRAEAQRILRSWANRLREALDEAHRND